MKKSEKDALKKAFNIPEPQHKDSFVSSYNELLKKNRRLNIPVFFRRTSIAVFAVLIIGLWGHLNKNPDSVKEFINNNPDIVTETTTASASTVSAINSTLLSSNDSHAVTITQTVPTAQAMTDSIATGITTMSLPAPPAIEIPETVQTATAVRTTAPKSTTLAPVSATRTATSVSTTKTVAEASIQTTVTTTDEDVLIVPTQPTHPSVDVDTPPATIPTTTNLHNGLSPAVNITTAAEPSADPDPTPGRDLTVIPSADYKKSGSIIDIEQIFESNAFDPSDGVTGSFDPTGNADYIVFGVINKITYTEVDGMPYTQEDITVFEVFKGSEIMPADKISVYVKGGYMPVSDFTDMNGLENTYPDGCSVYDSGGNIGTQNVGDTLLFCIKDGSYSMPDGAFMLSTGNDISVFDDKSDRFVSLGNNSLAITRKDLLNL
ncbi:MAG: hypothetical protein NC340_03255 [Ruminococcus flavefaciens]|nr:hypothetical protein [Ruminococcus flavefaciens]MCM1229570.1 hypothetical protein [Ruminococcus flavefaciens]